MKLEFKFEREDFRKFMTSLGEIAAKLGSDDEYLSFSVSQLIRNHAVEKGEFKVEVESVEGYNHRDSKHSNNGKIIFRVEQKVPSK